eukprot:TRINITY_DN2203_c0_g4_i4.p1 TRINITY_DN2203_c0_g4~~TRINITY_DN2203_c0_g4_i4.p1  ORF type:complete len:240 (-),score=37.66 TRINITY_DN2203_c0_g4_i4:11-730(-)
MVQDFLEQIKCNLFVKAPSDWYRVSRKQLSLVEGGNKFLKSFNSLFSGIKFAYPEYPWNRQKFFFSGKRSSQRWLHLLVKQALPSDDVIEDYNCSGLFWDSDKPVELDIYVPNYNLAFEYQGEQHYFNLSHIFGIHASLPHYQRRDQIKQKLCLEANISLIYIPYWWDHKLSSLIATIHKHRPDIITSKGDGVPIPFENPQPVLFLETRPSRKSTCLSLPPPELCLSPIVQNHVLSKTG